MSDDPVCGAHRSRLDANGDCSWCRLALGVPRARAPYVLTADDIEFLRGMRIDPELKEPNDFRDPGGD